MSLVCVKTNLLGKKEDNLQSLASYISKTWMILKLINCCYKYVSANFEVFSYVIGF